MSYFDDETKEKYIPYVIEPSLGADRVVLAFLCAAYDEEELEGGDMRTVLRFHPALAPVKIGILPLFAEELQLHLLKLTHTEDEVAGGDLIADRKRTSTTSPMSSSRRSAATVLRLHSCARHTTKRS